ncbi:hypothetical protein BKA62DRAFT_743235 [Auriculariales sp. MPI-PUGE-AT-0066]|nr:hypothetical protein BKA62DRAFT_743235 [Auriculariales sp. MPI-PUGE-AT-0066]
MRRAKMHPLDPTLLSLRDDERAFFVAQTGITEDDALRQHILRVQQLAYAVAPYPCIQRFGFTRLKISRHPEYREVLKLATSGDGRLLDLACCVGNDARKAVADGWPEDRVWATDLHADFWTVGHELFRSSPETCKITFVAGDLFDDVFWDLSRAGSASAPNAAASVLSPHLGTFAAIHVGAFFHLFGLDRQTEAARRCLALLSRQPGSIVFGSHIGSDTAGSSLGSLPHLQNVESWTAMWTEAAGDEALISDPESYAGAKAARGNRPPMKWLVWSVRRK